MKSKKIILLLMFSARVFNVQACSYPESPNFSESLKSATHVFVFQLSSTMLIHEQQGTGYIEYVRGEIRPVTDLKGNSGTYKTIRFPSHRCGGLALNTGHYFLLVTKDKGPEINFWPDDKSILDITGEFSEYQPEANKNSRILNAVKAALAGKIAPEKIKAEWYSTSMSPPPPTLMSQ